MRSVDDKLAVLALLRRRFSLVDGVGRRSKDDALAVLAEILRSTRYAVVGDLALALESRDPRTTLSVDLAVLSYDDIPRTALEAAGFKHVGRFEPSDNWKSPDSTPVQFTADPELREAVTHAEEVTVHGTVRRVARPLQLVRAKLRAAADPARRRSKRMQDLVDAVALAEDHPALVAELTQAERAQLGV